MVGYLIIHIWLDIKIPVYFHFLVKVVLRLVFGKTNKEVIFRLFLCLMMTFAHFSTIKTVKWRRDAIITMFFTFLGFTYSKLFFFCLNCLYIPKEKLVKLDETLENCYVKNNEIWTISRNHNLEKSWSSISESLWKVKIWWEFCTHLFWHNRKIIWVSYLLTLICNKIVPSIT